MRCERRRLLVRGFARPALTHAPIVTGAAALDGAPGQWQLLCARHELTALGVQELALHTPAREWYVETPHNNLTYWGLDYPPASGYQSWLCGKAIAAVEPAAVALGTSHGYETQSSKRLMRLSVLFFDCVCFFPAALAAVRALYGARASPADVAWGLAAVLLQPAFVLIDHGHFQYNNISLGLATAAVAAIARGAPFMGSVLYTLSFNHKQMALFYAPAFFAHLLGRCFEARRPGLEVARLGAAVVGTMLVLWAPFLREPGPLAVAARLAPIGRGVFEDFVASLWCAPDACAVTFASPSLFANAQVCHLAGLPLARALLGAHAGARRRGAVAGGVRAVLRTAGAAPLAPRAALLHALLRYGRLLARLPGA